MCFFDNHEQYVNRKYFNCMETLKGLLSSTTLAHFPWHFDRFGLSWTLENKKKLLRWKHFINLCCWGVLTNSSFILAHYNELFQSFWLPTFPLNFSRKRVLLHVLKLEDRQGNLSEKLHLLLQMQVFKNCLHRSLEIQKTLSTSKGPNLPRLDIVIWKPVGLTWFIYESIITLYL